MESQGNRFFFLFFFVEMRGEDGCSIQVRGRACRREVEGEEKEERKRRREGGEEMNGREEEETEKKEMNPRGQHIEFFKLVSSLYCRTPSIFFAYYGPDCFEAEERSAYETSEVLHLVSWRDLFGIVNIVDKIPQLSHISHEKLNPFGFVASGLYQYVTHAAMEKGCDSLGNVNIHEDVKHDSNFQSDVYKDLELRIYRRAVAVATRSPKCKCTGTPTIDSEDHIHVFLTLDDAQDAVTSDSAGSNILLGTITGLGTSAEEGSCSVLFMMAEAQKLM